MKKGFYAILAVLVVFAMVSCGGGDSTPIIIPPKGVKPVLTPLKNVSYAVDYSGDASIRVRVENADAIGADKLSYQWYTSATQTGAGTAVGINDRDYTPDVDEAYTVWYWVVVTSKKSGTATTTSNKAKLIVWDPSGDSAIERIVVQNAAMPLWEFTLPKEAKWKDYTKISIDYYVSKDSKIIKANSNLDVRSRSYGAYIPSDFDIPDQGESNGWGGTRIVSWNGTKVVRGEATGINPNNDFILDNAKGGGGSFLSVFSAEGGAASEWFTVTYDTAAGLSKEFARVTELDEEVDIIYVGAGIFGPGGNAGDAFEFYVKNPILVNEDDITLSILGSPTMSGTTEQLFAGNLGASRGDTTRRVLADDEEYKDIEGEIAIKFDVGVTGTFATKEIRIIIADGETSATLGDKFPTGTPTRPNYTFVKWVIAGTTTEADGSTEFDANTTITATWNLTTPTNFPSPLSISLTGQTTKNSTAWSTFYNDGFVLDLGTAFNADTYDTLTFVLKFYEDDGITAIITAILNSQFQLKWFPAGSGAPANANASGSVGTTYNIGADPAAIIDEDEAEHTWTINIPAGAKGGVRYLVIQSGGGTGTPAALTNKFIEVVSISAERN